MAHAEQRTNAVINPSFEVDLTGWSGVGGTLSRIATGGWSGSAFARFVEEAGTGRRFVTNALPGFTAGETVTGQARVKGTVGQRVAVLFNPRSDTASLGFMFGPAYTLTAEWQRISYTAVMPANTTSVIVGLSFVETVETTGDTLDGDAVMLTTGAELHDYFDGDTASDAVYSYAWTGTPHASTSIATAPHPLVATMFADEARVSVELDWSEAVPQPTTAVIERVNADGTIVAVRGADPAQLVGGQWVGNDYEAPLDEDFYYVASSTDLPGETRTSATYNMQSLGTTWLKHPGRPFLNTRITVSEPPSFVRPVSQGVFDVLGRTAPIAVTMRRNSARGDVVLYTHNDNERTALLSLLEDGSPLFLQTPSRHGVGNIYVSVGEVTEDRITHVGSTTARRWTLPLTVIDRPAGGVLAAGNSWSEVFGTYPSWSQLQQVEGTWLGVLEGIEGD